MKAKKKMRLAAVALTLVLAVAPVGVWKVDAATTATVSGTVQSGTTAGMLYLSTKEGKMEIKLDSTTDTSACKLLLPGNTVSVTVVHGSDEYLHATKISGGAKINTITLDESTRATVSGTIGSKSTGEVLYFNTQYGEMQIKMDATTDLSGCSVLVADQTYSIVVERGSDAYMHAIQITGGASIGSASVTASNPGLTPATADPAGRKAATMTFSGTVSDKTKENKLYLKTKDGEMQFVIEANTDTTGGGMVLTKDRAVTVSGYPGADEFWHAVDITGSKSSTDKAVLDMSNISTVTGKVNSKSSGSMLYFDIDQGTMEIKMDALRSVTGCKVLVAGKKLTITVVRGADAYMHVLDITG